MSLKDIIKHRYSKLAMGGITLAGTAWGLGEGLDTLAELYKNISPEPALGYTITKAMSYMEKGTSLLIIPVYAGILNRLYKK